TEQPTTSLSAKRGSALLKSAAANRPFPTHEPVPILVLPRVGSRPTARSQQTNGGRMRLRVLAVSLLCLVAASAGAQAKKSQTGRGSELRIDYTQETLP